MPLFTPSDYPFLGQVELGSGTALVGSINTIAIAGGVATNVNIINSAGWVVADSSQLLPGVAAVGSVGILGTVPTNLVNSAGWVVNVSNSGRALVAGSALVGTANVLGVVSAQWIAGVAQAGTMTAFGTVSSQLLASVAIIGTVATIGTLTVNFAITSSQLLAGVAAVGSVGVLNLSRSLFAGSSMIGTANVLGTVSAQLLASVAAIGSASILNALSVQPTTAPAIVNIAASAYSIGTATVMVLALNTTRRYVLLRNQGTDKIFFRLGAPAVVTDMFLNPGDAWEMPQLSIYPGSIHAIVSTAIQTMNAIEY